MLDVTMAQEEVNGPRILLIVGELIPVLSQFLFEAL
jgi:hypothetical protein